MLPKEAGHVEVQMASHRFCLRLCFLGLVALSLCSVVFIMTRGKHCSFLKNSVQLIHLPSSRNWWVISVLHRIEMIAHQTFIEAFSKLLELFRFPPSRAGQSGEVSLTQSYRCEPVYGQSRFASYSSIQTPLHGQRTHGARKFVTVNALAQIACKILF